MFKKLSIIEKKFQLYFQTKNLFSRFLDGRKEKETLLFCN